MLFDQIWDAAVFQNPILKNNEHVKENIKKICNNYLNTENITLLRIYDVPECSVRAAYATIEIEFKNLMNNANTSIQINFDLLQQSMIPYSINF